MRERYPTRGVHGKEKLSSFTVKSSSRTPISSVLPPPLNLERGRQRFSAFLSPPTFEIQLSINVDRKLDIEGGGDHLTDSNPAALLHPQTSMPLPVLIFLILCWVKWRTHGLKVKVEGRMIIMLTKVFCILITAAFEILDSNKVDRNRDIESGGDHLTDSNPAALLHPETSMLPVVASRPHLL